MHDLTRLIFECSWPWCVVHSVSSASSCRPFRCRTRGRGWTQCLPSSPWRPLCYLSVQTHAEKNTPLTLWLCALLQKHCVEQTEADLIVHSGREQTGIVQLVDTFPHFEGHAPLPPSGVLVFVDDAALQTEEQAQSEHTVGLQNVVIFFGHLNTPLSCSFMVRSQSKQPSLAS